MLRGAGLEPGARVLDVGAGTGRTVDALCSAGYDARGIDPEPRGPGVEHATIAEHQDRDLDAVVLWHVVEHLDDPRGALTRVHGWLRPSGLVVIGVPNLGSWQARIGGAKWHHLDLPRHRLHLTPDGLQALLAGAGFRVSRVRHSVPEHNPGGMWMALLARLGMSPSFPFRLLKGEKGRVRDRLLLVAGIPLAPVALGLEAVASAFRRGGTVAVLAERL